MERRVLLVILDGFGFSKEREHNAVLLAKTPYWSNLLKENPNSLLNTSGTAVGLPDGIMGNSEVGHLNIGGGRIIPQELTRIANFARNNGFESLPDVKRILTETSGNIHLMGLLSDGGVHSDQEHLYLLIDSVTRVAPNRKCFIHVITDGRDTPPKSASGYISALEEKISKHPNVKIASVVGRFYAMDRDKRWERVKKAYDCYSKGLDGVDSAEAYTSASQAIASSYAAGENDEFVTPKWIRSGEPIRGEDQLIFFNFRADRAREISMAFGVEGFKEFETPVKVKPKNWVTFTSYQKDFPFPALFSPVTYKRILGEEVARNGKKQMRISETEKYAHVTYFFNGGVEEPFEGEDRVLIPSPKEVATYDLKPEMSAPKVTEELIRGIEKDIYSLVVVNYANGDMVGHTGVESAAISAVETLDRCLSQVVPVAIKMKYDIIITADHGNCEQMVDPKSHNPFTQHTTNPVHFVWIGDRNKGRTVQDGILADVAPTVLDLLGWQQPSEMTGRSLIVWT